MPHFRKWRGVTFEAIAFELQVIRSERLKDVQGRYNPQCCCGSNCRNSRGGTKELLSPKRKTDKTVLRLIHADKQASFAVVARRAGWVGLDGTPLKAKVQRIIERLKDAKLFYKFWNNRYRLTKRGCRVIRVKHEADDDDGE